METGRAQTTRRQKRHGASQLEALQYWHRKTAPPSKYDRHKQNADHQARRGTLVRGLYLRNRQARTLAYQLRRCGYRPGSDPLCRTLQRGVHRSPPLFPQSREETRQSTAGPFKKEGGKSQAQESRAASSQTAPQNPQSTCWKTYRRRILPKGQSRNRTKRQESFSPMGQAQKQG